MTAHLRLKPASYAVVGSREYPRLDLVRAFIAKLPTGFIVISGAARGIDAMAESAARARLDVVSIPADLSRGRGAGIARNAETIAAVVAVLLLPTMGAPGTSDSIRPAKEVGKCLWICDAMGK